MGTSLVISLDSFECPSKKRKHQERKKERKDGRSGCILAQLYEQKVLGLNSGMKFYEYQFEKKKGKKKKN